MCHAGPRPLSGEEAFALSTLSAAVGLAVEVAQRESDSRSADETLASLTAAIPGVGEGKLARYGQAVLDALRKVG